MDIEKATTDELVRELRRREGVTAEYIEPYTPYEIHYEDDNVIFKREGPAIIIEIVD